jgi:acyl-CoA reductase-like NAD-dependent aldehyde dehydrogenase
MAGRLDIPKTFKLFIAGQFPRSESGRSLPIAGPDGSTAHLSRASRKDLRNAVEAAHAALPRWADLTAYNRGQVLYRMAEMLQARRPELLALLRSSKTRAVPRQRTTSSANPARQVDATIDRLTCFAGWADKYAQVLGCANPVAGPYHNFTIPEPTGIVGIVAPDAPSLLGLISLIAPPLCAGNTIVALASESESLSAITFAEICATSDVPPGAINILTGLREELVPHFASHREINAIHAAGISAAHAELLRSGAAENLKRITIRQASADPQPSRKTDGRRRGSLTATNWYSADCQSPWWIEPFIEYKTVWHPSSA